MAPRYFIFSSSCKELTTSLMDKLKNNTFRIGTRRSPLALIQAAMVEDLLKAAWPDLNIELVPMQSDADWNPQDGETPLCADQGGKGLFAKEIEESLLQNRIDCGVHSLKDMAAFLPNNLILNHFLKREDPRDCLISSKAKSISELPENSIIGTCSPRRAALIKSKRNDLNLTDFRGNVQTRIDKLSSNQVDATILAMAGLKRLNICGDFIHPLSTDEFMPACGQGIIAIESRADDQYAQDILAPINHYPTMFCAMAERAVLQILNGDCHSPIAAYATINNNQLSLRGMAASTCGQTVFEEEITENCQSSDDALAIGKQLGERLKTKIPKGFWA